jgi:hypothetical protein
LDEYQHCQKVKEEGQARKQICCGTKKRWLSRKFGNSFLTQLPTI